MTEMLRISHQELQPLPRWARLALALRCVRRARQLIKGSAAQLATIDSALGHIEQAAREAAASDELADAAADAYTLALDNLDSPANSGDEDTVVVTCMVAHATAFAAEAATLSDSRAATQLVGQAIDFAVHAYRLARGGKDGTGPVFTNVGPALAAMRADLIQLRTAASDGSWTDQTAVPEQFLIGP